MQVGHGRAGAACAHLAAPMWAVPGPSPLKRLATARGLWERMVARAPAACAWHNVWFGEDLIRSQDPGGGPRVRNCQVVNEPGDAI